MSMLRVTFHVRLGEGIHAAAVAEALVKWAGIRVEATWTVRAMQYSLLFETIVGHLLDLYRRHVCSNRCEQ